MQATRGAFRALAWLLCLSGAATWGADRFPFVIPGADATPSVTDLSGMNRKPAGSDGFVRVRDGRFHTDSTRLRIWGMNLCFDANFPSHEDAEKVAAHLAKLGLNGMRIHHHDGSARLGIWAETADGAHVFDPEKLDRQDYLLAQLIRHGIYINLNLHVSRTFNEADGFPGLEEGLPPDRTQRAKYLLYFEPRMRVQFKEFCRAYLTHRNPYRNLRRVDDPGIAMIEIVNENSFSKIGAGRAASLPEPYRGEFKRQWNVWLKARYGTTPALRAAWRDSSEPLGVEVADMGDLGARLPPWRLDADRRCSVEPVFGLPGPDAETKAVKLDILKEGSALGARLELILADLPVEEGRLHTLSFWARADRPRTLSVEVSRQGPDDWRDVGCKQTKKLSGEWTQVVRVFRAARTDPNRTRLCFKFGGDDTDVYLARVRLQRGGRLQTLPAGESLEQGNIDIPGGDWVDAATGDAHQFMLDTEKGFVADMLRFLKQELGVKVPITASQLKYQAPGVIAETCDYADAHAYWQHPVGPRAWAGEYTVGNTAMERTPGGRTPYLEAAASRLLDRPFTLSECNIANPSDYGASLAPTLATVAALQDWDGVFFFDYDSQRTAWFADRVKPFHTINGHPVKLAMLTACANLYRRADLKPLARTAAGTLDEEPAAALALSHTVGVDPKAKTRCTPELPAGTARLESPDGAVVWDASDPGKACVRVNTPASRAVWGLIAGQRFSLGSLQLEVGPIERDYGAIVVTSLDGRPLEESKRLLLAAVGSAENLGMVWNEDRTSVGNEWGRGPAQVNGIPARISLKNSLRAVHALDGRGARQGRVPSALDSGIATFTIGPEHRTLWYELAAE